jgi:hypothetical protein
MFLTGETSRNYGAGLDSFVREDFSQFLLTFVDKRMKEKQE